MSARKDRALVRRADLAAVRLCEEINACRAAGLEVYVQIEGHESDEADLGIWLTIKRDISPKDEADDEAGQAEHAAAIRDGAEA